MTKEQETLLQTLMFTLEEVLNEADKDKTFINKETYFFVKKLQLQMKAHGISPKIHGINGYILADTLLPLLSSLRSDMTTITRCLKRKRSSSLSVLEETQKRIEYKESAKDAAERILNNINNNEKLDKIEKYCADLKYYRHDK